MDRRTAPYGLGERTERQSVIQLRVDPLSYGLDGPGSEHHTRGGKVETSTIRHRGRRLGWVDNLSRAGSAKGYDVANAISIR